MNIETEIPPSAQMKAPASLNYAGRGPDAATTILLLVREWRLIAKFATAGVLLGLILAFVLPKKYRSTAELMPPENRNSGLSALSALSGLSSSVTGSGILGGLMGVNPSGDLFIGILQSATVQDDIIDKFDLRKVYGVKYYYQARKELGLKTEISEDRKSGIINITVIDRDPQRSAAIARQYITDLDRLVVQLDTSSAHREREFLEGRLKIVRHDLDTAQAALGQFSSKNATLDLTNQGRATLDAIGRLQGELIAARADLDGLQKIYGPENARVKAAQARVAELQHELQKLGGSSAEDAAGSSSSTTLYPSLRQLPLLGVTYADLYRRATLQAALYETLAKQYELARVEEAKEVPTVKVLDPPLVPEHKFSPPRAAIVILAFMMGAAFGVVLVLGRNRWAELPMDSRWKVLLDDIYPQHSAGSGGGPIQRVFFRAAEKRPMD